jgi:hypothetical protein
MRDAGLFESGIVDERDAEKIMEMINGTAVTFDAQGIMHQAARPENRLQAAVGDADMAGLGTSNGPMQRVLLFVEIQAKQGKLKLPGTRAELVNLPIDEQAFAAYMRGQVLLDENHEYMTAAARAAYTKGLERNAEWTRDCAEKTSTGEWNFADALQSAEKMWQMSVSDPSRSAPEPPSARQSLVGIGV